MRDAVYLAVPAYPLRDEAARAATLERAGAFAAALGLPLVASPLVDELRQPGAWLAADARRADLARALDHRVVLAARGGYGCIDLVEPLMRGERCAADRSPLLVGFSDVTVLHACFRRRGWRGGVYGFMPGSPNGARALASAVALARGAGSALRGGDHPTSAVVASGIAEGELFAACLRVLAGLVGTPAMPDLRGAIVAIEDVDERPYRIDRDLMQLWLAGALAGVRGLVFGVFPCARSDDDRGPAVRDIAAAWARRLGVPTIVGLPFGHDPDPIALPCGGAATLACEPDRWSLTIAPSAVAS